MAAWAPRAVSPLTLSPPQRPSDGIEFQGSSEEDSPAVRVAKRKRREALGHEYLRQRPPTILSAGLRGPFNANWKNPWAKANPVSARQQAERRSEDLGHGNNRQQQRRHLHAVSRHVRPQSSLSSVSSYFSEEEEEEQTLQSRRGAKVHSERRNDGRVEVPGTWKVGATRQLGKESKSLAGKERRNVQKEKIYKANSRQPENPPPVRRVQQPKSHYVSPISDESSSSGTDDELQQPVSRRLKSPAERLADAIESASRIKHKALRNQTLAFGEETRKNLDQKRAISPFPDIPAQATSRLGHQSKRSWDHSASPSAEPYPRKRAALSVQGRLASDSDNAKPRNLSSAEQQQTDRPKSRSALPKEQTQKLSETSILPSQVDLPIDFFVQPLQEMLAVASEARRWKDRLGSLNAEALASMPEDERNKLFRFILSLTGIRPEAAQAAPAKTVDPTPNVNLIQENPVPEVPTAEVRAKTTKLSAMDPPVSPIKGKRAGPTGDNSIINIDSNFSFAAENGARSRAAKPRKYLNFTRSGEVQIQVRRSQEDKSEDNSEVTSNKPSSTSNLHEAQVISNPPVLNTHLTSGSTNLLETDKPPVEDFDAQFSTQAALAQAQRSFRSDLAAHQRRTVSSQPTSAACKGSTSPSKPGGRDTRSSPIRDSFADNAEDSPLNTQDMVNAWTPFAVTTIKKPVSNHNFEMSPLELKAARRRMPTPDDRPLTMPEVRSHSNLSHSLLPSDFVVEHGEDEIVSKDIKGKTPQGSKSSVLSESKLATPPSDDSPPMRAPKDRHIRACKAPKLMSPTRLSHSQPPEAHLPEDHTHQQSNSQPMPGQFSEFNALSSKSQLSSSKLPASLTNFPSSISAGSTAQDGQRQSVIDRGLEEAENFLGTWDIESQLRSVGHTNSNSANRSGDTRGGRASQRKSQRLGKKGHPRHY
ncbi:MAG: hypothetical protein MMC33_004894 [Icmadophila ericetorum]|nr:hypothetical protein [Icmadophila ericetorum]